MAPPIKDLTNKRFGMLTVESIAGRSKGGNITWLCRCDCGSTKIIVSGSLANGVTRSCGCLKHLHRGKIKHGDSKSREFRIWAKMNSRCSNPKNDGYQHYGNRGITVCDRWKDSYLNFIADMGRAPTQKHEIDRIDNNGNYEPDNCRWATRKEQCNNMRTNRYIMFNGETKTLKQWCEIFSLKYETTRGRLKRGQSPDVLFNQPSL